MSKAFDRMDPNILISKLKFLNVNEGLIKLINDFLSDRQCCVKLKESSSYKNITMGTPQGTKLGPWLWLVYINDLTVNCSAMKYADDITLYAPFRKFTSSSDTFQTALDGITSWAIKNNMLINAKKTQLIQFTLSEPKYMDAFMMDNVQISPVESARLLGVTLDKRLTFADHVNNICKNMASRLYAMRTLKRLGLSKNGLVTYYTANIRSALTYACPVWASLISDQNMGKIRQVERKALKIIYADLTYGEAISECAIPTIELFIKTLCHNLITNIHCQESHPLHQLIITNKSRKTRISKPTSMPVCRTTKLQNSFFYKYSKIL